MVERHHAAVDFGASCTVAEIRMYLVRKIERSAADRYVDDLPAGRQNVDPVLEQVDAHPIEKIAFRLAALGGREQAPQLIDFPLVGLVAAAAFLIAPMRGHAAFGIGVHFMRADLNLDRLVARADDGGVYGPI